MKSLKLIASLCLLLVLPLAIFGLTHVQELRQRASTEAVTSGYGSGAYGTGNYGSSTGPSVTSVAITPSVSILPSPPTVLPTNTLSNTQLAVILKLHGLGSGGDSSNPNSGGNLNPVRTVRPVTIQLSNAQGNLVLTKQGTVTYVSSSGDFRGTIDLGNTIATAPYIVKVLTPFYLQKVIDGIVTITQRQTNTISNPIVLKAGDVDTNNKINILDYNILIGCYSDLVQAVSCDPIKKAAADINDDGQVNQFDYNLYVRETSTIEGN